MAEDLGALVYLSLKKRRDFLLLNHQGRFFRLPSLTLRARRRTPDHTEAIQPRVGFTITRKVGCSVVRHRIRRRFKEALRLRCAPLCQIHTDYVFIAQPGVLTLSFTQLQEDMVNAIHRIHKSLDANHRPKSC